MHRTSIEHILTCCVVLYPAILEERDRQALERLKREKQEPGIS